MKNDRRIYQPKLVIVTKPSQEPSVYQEEIDKRNRKIIFVVIGLIGSIALLALAYHFFGQAELWYSAWFWQVATLGQGGQRWQKAWRRDSWRSTSQKWPLPPKSRRRRTGVGLPGLSLLSWSSCLSWVWRPWSSRCVDAVSWVCCGGLARWWASPLFFSFYVIKWLTKCLCIKRGCFRIHRRCIWAWCSRLPWWP